MIRRRQSFAPEPSTKRLIAALRGEPQSVPPIWLMRQAGRYLPEYRELRRAAGSFLDLCLTPEHAVEITLQPVRRFGLDAAILFSDILVVPYALGQELWFEEGRGPRLSPLREVRDLEALRPAPELHGRLAPVYETLRGVRAALGDEVALIGFAGAPWTVASYMIEGGSSRDFALAKRWIYQTPESFGRLIDLLVEATGDYLCAQIDAGAEVVQIFDSWAGSLPAAEVRRWSLAAIRKIVARVRRHSDKVPVIVFPRGVGPLYREFAEQSGADALALDTAIPADWARRELQGRVALQGNLDPLRVVAGGEGMRQAARDLVRVLSEGPYVFNLGHGVVPETPPEHVAELVDVVRNG